MKQAPDVVIKTSQTSQEDFNALSSKSAYFSKNHVTLE